jgi:hypothetical protein
MFLLITFLEGCVSTRVNSRLQLVLLALSKYFFNQKINKNFGVLCLINRNIKEVKSGKQLGYVDSMLPFAPRESSNFHLKK